MISTPSRLLTSEAIFYSRNTTPSFLHSDSLIFWMTCAHSLPVPMGWFLPVFFRTLMHPLVARQYRRNAWITLSIYGSLFLIFGSMVWTGKIDLTNGVEDLLWINYGLISLCVMAISLSYAQEAIAHFLPHAAVSSGKGWSSLIYLAFGQKPNPHAAMTQDTAFFTGGVLLLFFYQFPLIMIFPTLILLILILRSVWIFSELYRLQKSAVSGNLTHF